MHVTEVVPLKGLRETKYCQVLCYPKCKQEELERRIKELERLGVQALEFIGEKSMFKMSVLGKGCVGVVVVAYTKSGRSALKIRRLDSDRKEMFHEGEMLKIANAVNVEELLLSSLSISILKLPVDDNALPDEVLIETTLPSTVNPSAVTVPVTSMPVEVVASLDAFP